MEPTRFSALLRQGFEDSLSHADCMRSAMSTEPLLEGLAVARLPELMRDRAVPLEYQDQLLAAVVRCYRQGPRTAWGPVLLEMLAPALVRTCSGLQPLANAISAEDIEQRLIAELLTGAGTMRLREPPARMQESLVRRAAIGTSRWLKRAIRQERHDRGYFSSRLQLEPEQQQALFDLVDLDRSQVSRADLLLIYRRRVLRQTLEELADELLTTPAAVRYREQVALLKLRQRLAA